MKDHRREEIEPQNWIPWIGLALVVPALLIMLVGFFGAFSLHSAGAGKRFFLNGNDAGSLFASLVIAIAAVGGTMLAVVGLVRGMRRSQPHNGRSVGIAGFSLEIVTLFIGFAALVALALAVL